MSKPIEFKDIKPGDTIRATTEFTVESIDDEDLIIFSTKEGEWWDLGDGDIYELVERPVKPLKPGTVIGFANRNNSSTWTVLGDERYLHQSGYDGFRAVVEPPNKIGEDLASGYLTVVWEPEQ